MKYYELLADGKAYSTWGTSVINAQNRIAKKFNFGKNWKNNVQWTIISIRRDYGKRRETNAKNE